MVKPTTRVLAVLDLLQAHGRMSGPELARRIGVGVRTLRRYIVMLEDLGVPLTTERGRQGAYMLVAGFKLPPMMFTNDEAAALMVGLAAARRLGPAETASAVEGVQAKLARVMPDGVKRQAQAVAGTIEVDLRGGAIARGSQTILMTLTTAAQARQRVHMYYVSAEGRRTERRFDPYGLAWRTGAWYVLGMCHLRHALRSFRLDRISAVTRLEECFAKPPDFDALDQLARSLAAIKRRHAIEVLLRTNLASARGAFPLDFGSLEPVTGGVRLRSSADDLDWFARRLAGLPFDFAIRSPAALRRRLANLASRLHGLAGAGAKDARKPLWL